MEARPIQTAQLNEAIQAFLERKNQEYTSIQDLEAECDHDFDFIKISHISYDRESDLSNLCLVDFQQFLIVAASRGGKFAYLIDSDKNGVSLYLGMSKQNHLDQNSNQEDISTLFKGIYPGSQCERLEHSPLIAPLTYSKAMLGIPSLKRDSDKSYKQSLEKILYPLTGKKFRILLVSESYERQTIQEILNRLFELTSEVHSLVKQNVNHQETYGDSKSDCGSECETEGESETSQQISDIIFKVGGASIAGGLLLAASGAVTGGATILLGAVAGGITALANSGATHSTNKGTSRTNSATYSINYSETQGISAEILNKGAEQTEKLLEKYIERFYKGLNYGLWNTSLYIQSDDEVTINQVSHVLKSVYSGDESFYESLRFTPIFESANHRFDTTKLPMLYIKDSTHPIHPSFAGFSTTINTEELAIISALPHHDVQGLKVSMQSHFALTQGDVKGDYIEQGYVLHKKEATCQPFNIPLSELNHHTFISGMTGSGKSNTIKSLLTKLQESSKGLSAKIPFLVIEPAKSEYKHLKAHIKDLQIFRPGSSDDVFVFNPFVFEKQEELTRHLDMLKVAFSAAFPMEGPMPYIFRKCPTSNLYR